MSGDKAERIIDLIVAIIDAKIADSRKSSDDSWCGSSEANLRTKLYNLLTLEA